MTYYDIACPYCGHDFDVCHDDGAHYTDGKLEPEYCPECEKQCLVETHVSFYHEAQKADCLNDPEGEHTWANTTEVEFLEDEVRYHKARKCEACYKQERIN